MIEVMDGVNKILVKAAECNDVEAVRLAIENGAEVNQLWHGETALHHAAKHSNIEMMKCLLQAGATPSVVNRECFTPLETACSVRSYTAAKYLISAGTRGSVAALNFAVQHNNLEVVKLLLSSGADVNSTSPYPSLVYSYRLPYGRTLGHSPLDFALLTGNLDIISALVEGGARLDQPSLDSAKATAFYVSLQHQNIEVLTYLIQNGAAINPICYSQQGSVSSPEYRELANSLVRGFMENGRYSKPFVDRILLLLKETGFQVQRDPYCKWLVENRKRWLSKKDTVSNSSSGQTLNSCIYKQLLLDMLDDYHDPDFCEKYRYPLSQRLEHMPPTPRLPVRDTDEMVEKVKLVKYFIHQCYEVSSLQSLCRIRIRNRLRLLSKRRSIKPYVFKLPVPSLIKKYLMIES